MLRVSCRVMNPALLSALLYLVGTSAVNCKGFDDQHAVARLGCYSDAAYARDLENRLSNAGDLNSPDYCVGYCRSRAFRYAGLQNGSLCSCGSTYGRYEKLDDRLCSRGCPGDAKVTCGGAEQNEIYATGIYPIGLISNPDLSALHREALRRAKTEGGVQRLGCYQDRLSDRDLPFYYFARYEANPERCVALCRSLGYPFAGVQSIDWCTCGNSFGRHGRLPETECHLWCLGDASATCGGFNISEIYSTGVYPSASVAHHLSLHNPDADDRVQRLGCYNGDRAAPDLPLRYLDRGNRMSPQFCLDLCRSFAYRFAGLTAGNVCRCGNTYGRYPVLKDTECGAPCTGDASVTCGGTDGMEVFSTGIYPPGSRMTRERNPELLATILSRMELDIRVQRLGCYRDNSSASPAGPPFRFQGGNATDPRYCVDRCRAMAFKFAGLQGDRCRCSNSLDRGRRTEDGECDRRCPGDGGVTCGGHERHEVYTTGIIPFSAMVNQVRNDAFRAWNKRMDFLERVQRLGCYDDVAANRAKRGLTFQHRAGNLTSPQFCVTLCRLLTYAFAGLKGGDTCSCGNSYAHYPRLDDDKCSVVCLGDAGATCGAVNVTEVFSTGADPSDLAAREENYNADFWRRVLRMDSAEQSKRLGCYEERGWTRPQEVPLDPGGAGLEPLPGPLDLPLVSDAGRANTRQFCIGLCRSKAYRYAGLRVGLCSCGNSYGRHRRFPSSHCSRPCPGDASVTCGSRSNNEVYSTGIYPSGPMTNLPEYEHLRQILLSLDVNRVRRLGCFSDRGNRTAERDLPYHAAAGNRASPAFCVNLCARKGYRLAGLQGGVACTCGNSHGRYGSLPDGECSVRCHGDASVTCGGQMKNEIFSTGIVPTTAVS